VAEGAKTLGGGKLTAAIGPGIGPCCYEVGEEVRGPFRAAFGDDVVTDGRLDLWSAAEQALRAAGCDEVERTDLCTYCHPELFFSHRRDRGRTGRQGVIWLRWLTTAIARARGRQPGATGPIQAGRVACRLRRFARTTSGFAPSSAPA